MKTNEAKTGIDKIAAERRRQIEMLGYNATHDDKYERTPAC